VICRPGTACRNHSIALQRRSCRRCKRHCPHSAVADLAASPRSLDVGSCSAAALVVMWLGTSCLGSRRCCSPYAALVAAWEWHRACKAAQCAGSHALCSCIDAESPDIFHNSTLFMPLPLRSRGTPNDRLLSVVACCHLPCLMRPAWRMYCAAHAEVYSLVLRRWAVMRRHQWGCPGRSSTRSALQLCRAAQFACWIAAAPSGPSGDAGNSCGLMLWHIAT